MGSPVSCLRTRRDPDRERNLGSGPRARPDSNSYLGLCEREEDSSHRQAVTVIGASAPGEETLVSPQNTPGTESTDEMRANDLNLIPVRCDMGIQGEDPNSPYSTPINLDDSMQSPEIICSSYNNNSITGKQQAHIPVQYAYPALEPAQRAEVSTTEG